jgi:proteasome lid subunit RPN8/RPN11
MRRLLDWLFGLPRYDRIIIERSALDDLCSMAQNAHPKEMLAFLAATRGVRDGTLRIDEIQLQAYDAGGDSAHVMLSNLPMTTKIIGTVHSHPGGSVRPSAADRHLFSKFGFVHAIIAEPYRPYTVAFYDKNGHPLIVGITQ